ncbi:MAG: hypothetical protein M3N93_13955 [Acidobacteriota bacterium]|nr:hypothetical protein [Acidobacteriota bacterium]
MKIPILIAAVCLSIAAPFASADTIQFIGVPTGVNDGQYYDLPYQIAIDGVNQLVTCYDIFDDVNFGDIWNANLLTLSQAAADGYFSGRPDALAGYERVAWLDAQPYHNALEQIGLQYAIWDVFGSARSSAAANTYLAEADAAAAAGYAGFSFSNARFIEQIGGVSGRPGTEQAFVYWQQPQLQQLSQSSAAPEPGTLSTFFLAIVSASLAAGFRNQRRLVPAPEPSPINPKQF